MVLVTLYNPTGEGGHQGGGVAAPLGGQIFSEILPYLDVNQGNTEEIENVEQIQTPDILNKSIKETEKILKKIFQEILILELNISFKFRATMKIIKIITSKF